MRNEHRRALCLVILALSLVGWVWAADTVDITVVTDRPDAMYKCGEQVEFLVSVKKNGAAVTSGEFGYTLTLDGAVKLAEGKGQLGEEPTAILGSLDGPGILRCTVTYAAQGELVVKLGAAAVCAAKIKPTAAEPDDFVRFWSHNKRKLARVPLAVQPAKAPAYSNEGMTVYKISLANILGTRVYGWFAEPNCRAVKMLSPAGNLVGIRGGRRTERLPAILTLPSEGVGPIAPSAVSWAERGFLAMAISIHDYDVDLPEEMYEELRQGALAEYQFQNRAQSRRTYYFLKAILGCLRSIDFLAAHPSWDGRNLIVTGSSQGAGLAVMCAGLDYRVSGVTADVPALCEHTGKLHERPSGWPQLIPDEDPLVTEISGYFDAVNFARYVKCPTLMGVGLIDTICAPTTVYSAFNVIDAHKLMICSPLRDHSQSLEYSATKDRWIMEQVFGRTKQALKLRGN